LELTAQQETVDLTDHYSLKAASVVVNMISHEARQVVEKASHEAVVEKASHAAMAGRAMADLTDSSQMAVENGEEANYLPPSSEQQVAKGQ
jgi:uncharacterized membrane-anchored protein